MFDFYLVLGVCLVALVVGAYLFIAKPLSRFLLNLDWKRIINFVTFMLVMLVIGVFVYLMFVGFGWLLTKGLGLQ